MKKTKKSFVIILIAFYGCNTSSKKTELKDTTISDTNNTIVLSDSQNIIIEKPEKLECMRGQAEPIIQKDDYPNTTFVLQPDSISAIETVMFDNGDKLIITNSGCEYYSLQFRFETSKYNEETTDLVYWYHSAERLMTGMLSGISSPIDIKRGIMFLNSYRSKNKENLKLRHEIDFDGDIIRNVVSVDDIEKINDTKTALTISFWVGPL